MPLGLAPVAVIEYSTTPPATGGGNGVAAGEGHGDREGEGELEPVGVGVRGGGAAPVGPLQPMVTKSTPMARARTPV
jgi:hypothetical protein